MQSSLVFLIYFRVYHCTSNPFLQTSTSQVLVRRCYEYKIYNNEYLLKVMVVLITTNKNPPAVFTIVCWAHCGKWYINFLISWFNNNIFAWQLSITVNTELWFIKIAWMTSEDQEQKLSSNPVTWHENISL